MKRTMLLPVILLVSLAACGTDASAPVDGPDEVTIAESGGCAMMGPNCATWTLRPDGSFSLTRADGDEVVAEASIDAATAGELFEEIAATDMDSFVSSLGPGECQGCVDGIDTRVEIDGPNGQTVLDSTEIGFDDSPLFVLIEEARSSMAEAAELPVVTR